MERLVDKLNKLELDDWWYYKNDSPLYQGFSDAFKNPKSFVDYYFQVGNKISFLQDDLKPIDISDTRCEHVVATYFIGCYLNKELRLFKKDNRSNFLQNNTNFHWAWFLCSLYHDIYSDTESVESETSKKILNIANYGFCLFADNFLYNLETIYKYACKGACVLTTHMEMGVCYDHGIQAGISLYQKYCGLLMSSIENDIDIIRFINGEKIFTNNYKTVSLEAFKSICKISKIIACHNIFIKPKLNSHDNQNQKLETVRTIEKYNKAGLGKALNGKLRLIKSKGIGEFELFFWLLCLVDNIECTKREIDLNTISIEIRGMKIKLQTNFSNDEKKQSYYNRLCELRTWLDGIDDVTIGEDVVHINFAQGIVS